MEENNQKVHEQGELLETSNQKAHEKSNEKQQDQIENQQNSSLHLMVETELKTNLEKFFNEIDLAFDYVPKSDVEKLNTFLKGLCNDNITKFTTEILERLKPYETKLSYIVMSKTKLKSSHFAFLNEIVLFNDILNFNVFTNENKNTKRTIVNYLYNMYMSSFVLQSGFVDISNVQDFAKQINQFVSNLKIQNEKVLEVAPLDKKAPLPGDLGNILSNMSGGIGGGGIGGGGFGNVLQSLMGNKEIMNLASDLSKDIQSQNLDPMALLSSMMSGKPNSAIENLVSNITGKIEEKINNGDIDKDLLQSQAQSILKELGQKKD
jgi:hypothetical protein